LTLERSGERVRFKLKTMSESLLVPTTLKAKEMERLDRLRRRCDWLKRRIANHRGHPAFDKAELSALEWAIRFIEDATAWIMPTSAPGFGPFHVSESLSAELRRQASIFLSSHTRGGDCRLANAARKVLCSFASDLICLPDHSKDPGEIRC
jgi:hypothetical protein